MRTTVSVICYKSKILADGTHPLMLRITKDGKRVFKSLGISVLPQDWDFKKEQPKPRCVHCDLIRKKILQIEMQYQTLVLEKECVNEEYTAQSILTSMEEKPIKAQTVEDFYKNTISELRENGQVGTSYAYQNSWSTLKSFNRGKPLQYTFSHIDKQFCKRFENWMRRKGNKDTTLSFQFRTLRAVYNRAIDAQVVSKDKNPFIEFKLNGFSLKTKKRALSKEDIRKIIDLDCSGQSAIRKLAHDLFAFSYLCGGISFVDIANLTPINIIEGRLIYRRQKTHGEINLLLSSEAIAYINHYSQYQSVAGYLFPILHKTHHITQMQKHNRVRKVCRQVNSELKEIAKELNIEANVTTYVARHTFATVLKKSGVNIGIISQALGHQDIQTTQIYLSKFDDEQVDEAMKNLL